MAVLKRAKVGIYGTKNRAFQKRVSYERLSMSGHTVFVHKFLGDALGTDLDDISDPVLMEITDRKYDKDAIEVNVGFDNDFREQVDLSHLGILNPLAGQREFQFHTLTFEEDGLGRYIMEGDIFYVPDMMGRDAHAYFMVTSVDKKNEHETYTVIVHAEPLKATTQTLGIEDDIQQPSNENELVELMWDAESEAEKEATGDMPDYTNVGAEPAQPDTTRDDFLDSMEQFY